ncbi:DUF6503 family protein [Aquimarina sp. 2201CG1-2-11]|uniref:DUF6503 family protein n=1 Tax=Aquimarina discodermiae TaxID=3231043 RepID=UPI0034631DA9
MKYLSILFFTLSLFGCTTPQKKLAPQTILQRSILKHDPNTIWATSNIQLHIQEPRLSNPHRYSVLKMNNNNHSFELLRNRDSAVSKHSIDTLGYATTLLNNQVITDTTVIKKYKLQPERNILYQKFYYHLIGLPMSLDNASIKEYGTVTFQKFNAKNSFKLPIELKEKIISKHWNLFIDQNDYILLGLEIVFPNDLAKGERLYFDGEININTLKIPRIRHWHEYDTNDYSGSDIIIKAL